MQGASAKRRHIRFSCEGSAEIMLAARAGSLVGTILDLSREGCLFLLKEPVVLEPSTRISVTFRLNRQQFEMAGVVQSQRQGTRVGIRFENTNAKLGSQLGTLIAAQTAGWTGRIHQEQGNESQSPENGAAPGAAVSSATEAGETTPVETVPAAREPDDPKPSDAQTGS